MNRDIRRYFKDKWNVLDGLGLLFLSIGMAVRWSGSTSPWGPGFYALSAPLIISRVLFFAQILPFQGPMVEASFGFPFSAIKPSPGMSNFRTRYNKTQLSAGSPSFRRENRV